MNVPVHRHLPIRKYRKTLRKTNKCAIVSVYLSHGKGGYDACGNRVFNGRGGSKPSESVNGYDLAGNQAQTACSLQSQWDVAYHTHRYAEVPRHDQEHIRTGKLITVLSVASRLHSSVSGQQNATLYPPATSLIVPYGNDERKGRRKRICPMEQPSPICAWCPCDKPRKAVRRYGSIPLCNRCYRYAAIESDLATRQRLSKPWKVEREVRA